MYAIFNHKGKQYKVSKNDFLKLPKLSDLKKNDTLTLEDIILLKTENDNITIGTPIIKGVKIKAKVIDQIRDNKIIVFKKKRRHNYRRKIGHRQDLTLVKIEEIITSSSSNKKLKEEDQPKKEVLDGS
jgi:large subunit ribosomal protein L21